MGSGPASADGAGGSDGGGDPRGLDRQRARAVPVQPAELAAGRPGGRAAQASCRLGRPGSAGAVESRGARRLPGRPVRAPLPRARGRGDPAGAVRGRGDGALHARAGAADRRGTHGRGEDRGGAGRGGDPGRTVRCRRGAGGFAHTCHGGRHVPSPVAVVGTAAGRPEGGPSAYGRAGPCQGGAQRGLGRSAAPQAAVPSRCRRGSAAGGHGRQAVRPARPPVVARPQEAVAGVLRGGDRGPGAVRRAEEPSPGAAASGGGGQGRGDRRGARLRRLYGPVPRPCPGVAGGVPGSGGAAVGHAAAGAAPGTGGRVRRRRGGEGRGDGERRLPPDHCRLSGPAGSLGTSAGCLRPADAGGAGAAGRRPGSTGGPSGAGAGGRGLRAGRPQYRGPGPADRDVLRQRLGEDVVTVAHSRFLAADRAAKDAWLLRRFGPDGRERLARHVVVASQVAEQRRACGPCACGDGPGRTRYSPGLGLRSPRMQACPLPADAAAAADETDADPRCSPRKRGPAPCRPPSGAPTAPRSPPRP
ncbi:hypothetical protein [Streptomyces thermoviolaceus]|uniref:hypothetical protein n=1 Tax=Streptomyces thermoviolaceus TaxID=1952 RepID=UPI004032CD5C